MRRIADVQRHEHMFTDGCGLVSVEMARRVMVTLKSGKTTAKHKNLALGLSDMELPSVYQIRFEGCKGVLTVAPFLRGEQIVLRDSMRKFEVIAR